jgi:hypothetical protein
MRHLDLRRNIAGVAESERFSSDGRACGESVKRDILPDDNLRWIGR